MRLAHTILCAVGLSTALVRCSPAETPRDAASVEASATDAATSEPDVLAPEDTGVLLLDASMIDAVAMDVPLDQRASSADVASEAAVTSDVATDTRSTDATSDARDASDASDASDAAVCSGATTFACGAVRCTLFEVCARTRTTDSCHATATRDRCLPCSTQYFPALPLDFCASGVRQYSGDPLSGCVISCL
ncbi:MAG: hypothetical protein U0269_13475 [Polyangiales bacterium]